MENQIPVQSGNVWDHHPDSYIVVTTNGVVNPNGELIMGKGIALEAKNRYPLLPIHAGNLVKNAGNYTFVFPKYKLITFPTKHHWRHKGDINLIQRSIEQLLHVIDNHDELCIEKIYAPLLGCGNGGLKWETVSSMIMKTYKKFNGRLIFVSK